MDKLKAELTEKIKQLEFQKEALMPESRHVKKLDRATRDRINQLTTNIVGANSELNAIKAIGKICKVDLDSRTFTFGRVVGYHRIYVQTFILDVVAVDEEYSLDDRILIGREKRHVKIQGVIKIYKR